MGAAYCLGLKVPTCLRKASALPADKPDRLEGGPHARRAGVIRLQFSRMEVLVDPLALRIDPAPVNDRPATPRAPARGTQPQRLLRPLRWQRRCESTAPARAQVSRLQHPTARGEPACESDIFAQRHAHMTYERRAVPNYVWLKEHTADGRSGCSVQKIKCGNVGMFIQ